MSGTRQLSSRLLLIMGGTFAALCIALALLTLYQFRSYHSTVQMARAKDFATRIVETNPELWSHYKNSSANFGNKLRTLVLLEPDTGLYLLDNEGRVLASAGEGRLFWSSMRIDLKVLREALDKKQAGIYGADPDTIDGGCYVTGHAVLDDTGQARGWIYVVARNANRPLAGLFGEHAFKTALIAMLLVLLAAALITWCVRRLVTQPLAELTQVAENVRVQGFNQDICHTQVPQRERSDEIGLLARSFSAMLERLNKESALVKQNDTQRREMVQNISHDLRTPLTVLMGQLETVSLKRDMQADEQLRYVRSAFQNARQLQRLTEALAEQAALDSPDFSARKELVDLTDMVSDSLQGFEAKASQRAISLNGKFPESSVMASLDARLIERALNNFLDNAFRATPDGGIIEVRLIQLNDYVALQVEDSGCGVAPHDQERVFERFAQGTQARSERGTAGLGLAIVRRIAQLHQGDARLAPEVAVGLGGACFELTLPLSPIK